MGIDPKEIILDMEKAACTQTVFIMCLQQHTSQTF